MTNASLEHTMLTPNHALKANIDEAVQNTMRELRASQQIVMDPEGVHNGSTNPAPALSGALSARVFAGMKTKGAATRLEELVSKCCAAKDGTLCTDVHVRVSARPCDHLREFVSCHESHHQ
jgi:hypothetical protein